MKENVSMWNQEHHKNNKSVCALELTMNHLEPEIPQRLGVPDISTS